MFAESLIPEYLIQSDELAIHSTLHSCNQSQEEAIREAVKQ